MLRDVKGQRVTTFRQIVVQDPEDTRTHY